MNKIYKVIWSKTRNCYVAVSEIAKRNGKDRTSVTGGAAGSRQAARVLCALLLGAYLTAGYSMPVAWGTQVSTNEEGTRSRWGTYAVAEAENSTAWGVGESNKMLKASGIGSTAFGHSTNAIGDYSTAWGCGGVGFALRAVGDYSTAFGFATTAYSNGSTAWGNGAIAGNGTDKTKGEYATAWGGDTRAEGKYATSFGYATTASGEGATAWGGGDYDRRTVASGNYSTAFGTWTNAKSENSTAWGYRTIAGVDNTTGKYATAFGNQTTANTEGSTAWGYRTVAGSSATDGQYSTAWGQYSEALGHYSTAFGGTTGVNKTIANAENSLAALGGVTETAAANSAAIGVGAKASLADTVALGSGAVANRAKYDASSNPYSAAFSANATDATTTAWRSTHNAIAVGEDSTVTRQITGVAAGSADTDAVNVAQLTAAVAGAGGGTAYTAGDGIAIDDTTKAISVKANTVDFEFDSTTKALTIKKGTVASGDTGLVTGGSVFTAIQTETRVSSDGNYIQANNSAAANLSALDTQVKTNTDAIATKANATDITVAEGTYNYISAGPDVAGNLVSLDSQVKTNTDAIATKANATDITVAEGTYNYISAGPDVAGNLVSLDSQVKTNTDAIATKANATDITVAEGTYNYISAGPDVAGNLVSLDSQVKTNTDAIATKANATDITVAEGTYNYISAGPDVAGNLVSLDSQVKTNTDAIADKADKATTLTGYGITDAYTIAAADAKFAMLDASNLSDENVTAWSTKLGTGSVASGNTGIVTGGTVFAEVRPVSDGTYVKKANSTAANLSALDNALAGKVDSTSVYTKSDVYTKTEADAAFAAINATNIDVAAWSTKLGTGAVASGNTGLVTGGKVFTAIQTETRVASDGNYIRAANSAAANLSALDTQVKTNAVALAGKADTANVYTRTQADTTFATKTELDTKADKTELAAVKTTVESLAGLDSDTIDAIKDMKNQDGEIEASGTKAEEFVKGSTVYDYLNKDSLELGSNSQKIAVGKGSKIQGGTKSLAIGFDNTVDGDQNIAIGTGHTVKGSNNIVIGDPNTIDGNNNGIFGNNVTVNGSNTFVIGHNVKTSASDAVVLGNGSEGVDGAVSVGAKGKERQIKHVADGTDDTDAVNKRQLDAAIDQAVGANMVNMSNSINKLDSRINKVGAGAAALAALHPIDTDDKFTMGIGYGNYRSAHSAAIGIFYRPTEKIMLSVGGAMGNGENMINAGISFALDKGKGFGTSKAAMARKIAAQGEEIQSLKAENAEIKEQNAKLAERLAAIEAKLGK